MKEGRGLADKRRTDYPWNDIKMAYITGTESTYVLADRFDVPRGTLSKRSAKEGWPKERKKYQKSVVEKATKKAANKLSSKLTKLQIAADNLANEMEKRTSDMKKCTSKDVLDYTKSVRELTAAIRNLYEIPTAAEKEAQRIAAERLKLEKERLKANDGDNSVTVVFEGGEDLREGAADDDIENS